MLLHPSFDINEAGHLTVAGLDAVEIAREFGTPAYLLDIDAVRAQCRLYRDAFRESFGGDSTPAYAGKALCYKGLYTVAAEEGMLADCVSPGELHTAFAAGFPMDKVFFHGNNKTDDDLRYALELDVGHIVVDGEDELEALERLALLLLAAEGRLLEWTAMGMDFGAAWDGPAWLTVAGEYGRRLNVALLEAVLLAVIAAFLIVRMKRLGQDRVCLRDALFLLGLCETLMISMRRDTYMMWGFVHQEQLYFYLLSALMAILAGREAGRPAAGVFSALLTAGAVTFLEFALDGRVVVPFSFMRDWADLFWYSLFALCLAAFSSYYFHMRHIAEGKEAV